MSVVSSYGLRPPMPKSLQRSTGLEGKRSRPLPENLPPRNFSGCSWNFRRRWGFDRLDTLGPPSASSTIVCGRLARDSFMSRRLAGNVRTTVLRCLRPANLPLLSSTRHRRKSSAVCPVLTSERAGPEQVQRGEGRGPRGETKDSMNTLIIKVIPTCGAPFGRQAPLLRRPAPFAGAVQLSSLSRLVPPPK